MAYPLKLLPYFRHGEETPWGGSGLRDVFGKDIPDERTGEALEISALPGRESIIANGEFAGKKLCDAIALWGNDLTGCGTDFPLLLKLLDAKDMLSVQVHPDDAYASANENGKLGKTEAWLVLSADADSKLVYGVNAETDEELKAYVESGDIRSSLRWVKVHPGDVLYIPHGCVHALGGGLLIYEIQQSSDVTYRFYDWDRLGKDGKPRELHTKKALDVSRPSLKLDKLPGATVICEGGSCTYYISDRNFELSRLNLAGTMPLKSGRMLLITSLGETEVAWVDGGFTLAPGESALIPACMSGVTLSGRTTVMCSSLPDREALKNELGYRAELVAGLTEDI